MNTLINHIIHQKSIRNTAGTATGQLLMTNILTKGSLPSAEKVYTLHGYDYSDAYLSANNPLN